MATIARTTKAGSGTGDFAAATTIVASEMNADLNTIYNEFNGSIAAANLASNAVTTAKILDANVTLAKLAVGASRNIALAAAVTAGLSFTTVETTLVTSGAQTFRGGTVLIFPAIGGVLYHFSDPGTARTLTVRYKIDGVTSQTIISTSLNDTIGSTDRLGHPLAIPPMLLTPTAGSHTLTITAQTSSADMQVDTDAASPGVVLFVELA